jgi:hypothetical protein
MNLEERFSSSKPRKGDRGTAEMLGGEVIGFTVSSVEGNLCYAVYDGLKQRGAEPFIWRFKDGLNTLHSWPSKSEAE